MHHTTLSAIATSRWSQAHRIALVLIGTGAALSWEDLVPRVWNRKAKALGALRQLRKAGHLAPGENGLALLETSFTGIDLVPSSQLALHAEPGLEDALAEVSARPVLDRTLGPSQDGQPVPSKTGQVTSAGGAAACALSQLGHTRSSNGSKGMIDQFDDRVKRGEALGFSGFGSRDEHHREAIHELLAKHPGLVQFKAEFLKRKSGTSIAFRMLMERNAARARALLSCAADKKKPAAFLNRSLHNEASSP